ncbi:MAG: alpha/beta hydrolase [Oscillospiraceae bacterium]|nr:alpha/beta hydrolase [Oscillospiraceae bacterium]
MFIEIKGVKTHYIEAGTGDPLLILHGWGCDASVYSRVVEQLSKRYRVILPELPGFGQSEEPPADSGGWTVLDYAVFVREFCVTMGLTAKPLIIFAHSLGCRISVKFISMYEPQEAFPEITKIIFTGAAGIKPKSTAAQKRRARLFKLKKLFLKPFPKLVEKMRRKYGSADYRNASPIMRQTLVKIVNEDLRNLLPQIKKEVLLIWGENDDSTPLSDGKLMEELLPNAGLAVIKNAGHYAFLEQPELFAKILDSYLGGGE